MEMNENNIELFLHCKKCIESRPDGISPKDYQEIGCGWTKQGLQVWCNRHDCNVLHVDFEGQKHPADLSAADREGANK